MKNEKEFTSGQDALLSIVADNTGETPEKQENETPQETDQVEEDIDNISAGEEGEDDNPSEAESHTDSEELTDSETTDGAEDSNDEAQSEVDLDDISDWDSDSPDSSNETPAFDFGEIGKELGNQEINSKESLVEYVKSLNETNSQLKSQTEAFTSLDENLRKAIEIAQNKGDYMEYLGIAAKDVSSYDPAEVYEAHLIQSGAFNKADGSLDEDRLDAYLDGMSEDEVAIRGTELKNQLVQQQKTKKQQLEIQAQEKVKKEKEKLKSALNEISSVEGFKLKPQHKKALFDGISSGKLFDKHYRNEDGSYNYQKAIENTFLLENREAIFSYLKTKARNQGKSQVYDRLTNPDVHTSSSKPEVKPKQKPEGIDAYMQELQNRFKN